jgi:hypothetical protein
MDGGQRNPPLRSDWRMQIFSENVEDPVLVPLLQKEGRRRRPRNFANAHSPICTEPSHLFLKEGSSHGTPSSSKHPSYFTRFPLVPQPKPHGHPQSHPSSRKVPQVPQVPRTRRYQTKPHTKSAATLNGGSGTAWAAWVIPCRIWRCLGPRYQMLNCC